MSDLIERLNEMAVAIDEDWAADLQEGGNAPRPRNVPAEALEVFGTLRRALGDRDAMAAHCPIDKQFAPVCDNCGATPSDGCPVKSAADWAFVDAAREALGDAS